MSDAASVATVPAGAPKQERTITVVTSDNADAYYNERLGAPAPTELVTEDAKDAVTIAQEAEKAEAEAAEEVKKNPKIEARFHDLTEKRKTAETAREKSEAAAKEATARAEAAERQAAELLAKYEPPKSEELGPEPQPEQFVSVADYAKALKDWTSDKVMRDHQAAENEKQEKARAEQVTKDWQGRVTALQTEVPDYEAVINASDVKVSDQVRDAIVESEEGPRILLHLAQNPDEAARIGKLTIGGALKAIGRLEAQLGKPVAKESAKDAPKAAGTPVSEVSKAPAPIVPLRGGSAPAAVPLNASGEFIGTYEQYKALRQSGKIK